MKTKQQKKEAENVNSEEFRRFFLMNFNHNTSDKNSTANQIAFKSFEQSNHFCDTEYTVERNELIDTINCSFAPSKLFKVMSFNDIGIACFQIHF